MSVLFVAVPAALAFAISAVLAFLWASRSGQLDDLDTPALRMLHDDPPGREAAGVASQCAKRVDQAPAPRKHVASSPRRTRRLLALIPWFSETFIYRWLVRW